MIFSNVHDFRINILITEQSRQYEKKWGLLLISMEVSSSLWHDYSLIGEYC